MMEFMTFSQCLNRLMKKHSMSATTLADLVGVRTGLRRVLTSDDTESTRIAIYQSIVDQNLFSEEEREQLFHSLDVSRVGAEKYKFNQLVTGILAGKIQGPPTDILTNNGASLKQRFTVLKSASKVDILCLNCCFRSMTDAVKPLFDDPKANVSMRHLIVSRAFAHSSAEPVYAMLPLLFEPRYTPYSIRSSSDSSVNALNGNLLMIRYSLHDGEHQMFFIMTDAALVHELPTADAAKLYDYCSSILTTPTLHQLPLLESRERCSSFSSLCMMFLSHELNRSAYALSSDLCFPQLPTNLVVDALSEQGTFEPEQLQDLLVLDHTMAIHEQRYQNHYSRKKTNYRVMTIAGCTRFLKTGYLSDHFFAMRPFRRTILKGIINAARSLDDYYPLLIREPDFHFGYHLIGYENLGVSIHEAATDYDLSMGEPSVFLTFPEFTNQFTEYFLQNIVAEKCYSLDESLAILEEMLEHFTPEDEAEVP